PEGHNARMALLWLAISLKPINNDFDKRDEAATELKSLCGPGSPFRDEFLKGITQGLENQNVEPHTKHILLDALVEFAKSSDDRKLLASKAISKAFVDQFANQPENKHQSLVSLQKRMLELLKEYKVREVYPDLEAAIEKHPFHEVTELARQTLADLRDRVMPEWSETKPSRLPIETRVKALANAITDGDSDELVRQLFVSHAGSPIVAGDRRIELYRMALTDGEARAANPDEPPPAKVAGKPADGTEKVHLAAALVILQKENQGFSNEDRQRALAKVARISLAGSEYGYRQDASLILDQFIQDGVTKLQFSEKESFRIEKNEYGRSIVRELNGKVTHVMTPDGKSMKFSWDGDTLTRYVSPGGLAYSRLKENGRYLDKWKNSDGGVVISTADRVTFNGDYSWTDSTGLNTTKHADGTVTYRHVNGKEITKLGDKILNVKTPPAADGRRLERHFKYDNGTLFSVTDATGTTYLRSKDESGRYIDKWVDEKNPSDSSSGKYTVHANGDYSWKHEGSSRETRYTADGCRSTSYSDGSVLLTDIEGRTVSIKYKDYGNDIVSRTFEYDGKELVAMTYVRRGSWRANESVRVKGADGKYTDDWTVTWHNPDLNSQQTATFTGRMSVSPDGDYNWAGFNGFKQSHKFDGKLIEGER
ncbi:MAG: hypothetical protein K2Z81_08915, partial [Cyanobacteria bacterium]|nr:hypothetical protein [Cyanobacteriota bacterium]